MAEQLDVDTDALSRVGQRLTHVPSRSGITRLRMPNSVASDSPVLDQVCAARAQSFNRALHDVGRGLSELGAALAQVGMTLADVDNRSADAMEWR